MTALRPARIFFHALLWSCAAVLLGLTAYRIHYTKGLSSPSILTSRTHFYDGVIVELLVTSCLVILGSLGVIIALAAANRTGWGSKSFLGESVYLWIVWIMFLVGAAVATNKWLRLKWCRGGNKACRILETIKAFSWICFGLTSFLIIFAIADYFWSRTAGTDKAYRNQAYPETRAAPVAAQPATQATHPTTTETTYTEVRATNEPPVASV